MAIVPMKKMLICGLKKDRKGTLEFLQRQGVLEISSALQEDATFGRVDVTSSKNVFERNAALAGQAIEILEEYAPENAGMLASLEGRKAISTQEYEDNAGKQEEVMEKVFRLQALAKTMGEQKASIPKLEQQLEALSPWKSFDLPLDFKGTRKSAAFIGSIQEPLTLEQIAEQLKSLAPDVQTADVQIVSSSKEQTCLFIVCARTEAAQVEDALKKMSFAKAPLTSQVPAKQAQSLEAEIAQVKNQLETEQQEIRDLAPSRDSIKFIMDYYTMRAEKYEVLGGLLQSRRVFFITGYVPADKAEALQRGIEERFDAMVSVEAPDGQEDVPVLLENNGFAAPVESVVESYSLPGKTDVDPSMIVAVFYYIMFGLMLSDAAYGIIIFSACAYCLHRFKNMEPGMKNTLKMFMYCGIATTFWGFMFGSFFGDAVNVIATTFFNRPDISLKPIWFEPVSLPMKMLVFSFLVGIIHLFTGLGVKLYNCIANGQVADGIYDAVFWYMLVGGCIIYLLTMEMVTSMLGLSFTLPAAAGTVAAVIALIGLVGIVLTSGRESKNWFKRFLKGLYGAYGITSYLSDVLSYSRLLALGLATSVISTVFNKLGSMLGNSIPGIILFILVFILGHSLNLAITV